MKNIIFIIVIISTFTIVSGDKTLAISDLWRVDGESIVIKGLETIKNITYMITDSASNINIENIAEKVKSFLKIPEYI